MECLTNPSLDDGLDPVSDGISCLLSESLILEKFLEGLQSCHIWRHMVRQNIFEVDVLSQKLVLNAHKLLNFCSLGVESGQNLIRRSRLNRFSFLNRGSGFKSAAAEDW